MFDRNSKPIKWAWGDLGVNIVRPPMVADPARILKWISFPDSKSITIRFYPELGRAIAIITGCSEPLHVPLNMIQNASKNSGWDVDIVSDGEFDERNRTARLKFEQIDGVNQETATILIENGYFGYDDLSIVEPKWLSTIANLAIDLVDSIIEEADRSAENIGGDPIGGDLDPLDG